MPYVKDPRVDAYLDGLPTWQREICSRVRDLVHAADPDVEETIKRTVQPYFVLDGNICALLAAKEHVNVSLYDGAIVPDPEGIITAGHDNKTARTVAFRRDEKINERALVWSGAAVVLGRAGLMRALDQPIWAAILISPIFLAGLNLVIFRNSHEAVCRMEVERHPRLSYLVGRGYSARAFALTGVSLVAFGIVIVIGQAVGAASPAQ